MNKNKVYIIINYNSLKKLILPYNTNYLCIEKKKSLIKFKF